ncbi:MAG: thioredoxin domain-containing protein, partial [Proteobacteria bacterium]
MFATRLASKTFFVLTLLCIIASDGFASEINQENKPSNSSSKIAWQDWRDDIFIQAKKEKKLVLLDLKAVWCHWCHVMDEKTYSDSAVAAEISKNFLPTHVDQDSRPDLAARYEDYGWPATIIFTPDGKEIVKKSGYITPVAMAELLRKVAKDPSPLPDEDLKHPEVLNPALSEELKTKFEADILDRYDQKQGSWDVSHKFIDANFAELYLNKSLYGDKKAAKWLKQTLDNNLKIHDPVWGGVYQYSTGGVWNEAHFEKIMSIQADNIRIY